MSWLTPSRQFVVFWIFLVIGIVIGSYFEIHQTVLVVLVVFWLLTHYATKSAKQKVVVSGLTGTVLGMYLWQLDNGEAWLKLGFLAEAQQVLFVWRDSVIDSINQVLIGAHGSLLSGILFGNRIKLDRELTDIFRTVGLTHIIAVSGYNLTILSSNIRSLLWPALGKRSLYFVMAVILLFVLITGAPASILRAGVMIGLVLYAQYIGRPNSSLAILLFATGILAAFEPKIIFDIGFQLSVAATYGLLRVEALIRPLTEKLLIPASFQQVISETMAATIITAPIIVFYFERLSIISPIANVLVLPLIPLLMAIGIFGVALLLIVPLIGQYVVLLTWPILEWIIACSTFLANQPNAAVEFHLNGYIFAALMIFTVAIVEWLRYRKSIEPTSLLWKDYFAS